MTDLATPDAYGVLTEAATLRSSPFCPVTAGLIELILASVKAEYFSNQGWTGFADLPDAIASRPSSQAGANHTTSAATNPDPLSSGKIPSAAMARSTREVERLASPSLIARRPEI